VSTPEPEAHGTGATEALESIPAVARFDEAAEALLARLRGHPAADRLMYSLSALADFSLLWQLAAGLRTLPEPKGHRRFAALAIGIGVESLAVNQGVKRLTGRARPVHAIEHPFHVRTPSTSSFPSGHASSAFFAAVLLSSGHRREAPVWFTLAALVSASRPYVGAHHPSDVAVGAALGTALGAGWLALVKRLGLWP
jgi:membrane-associated phospholipid phosphatase